MRKQTVDNQTQIPDLMTEKQTQEFWASHSVGVGLFAEPLAPDLQAKLKAARAERHSRNITVNLASELEQRLRHMASLKKVPYQRLLKDFVLERLYEEEKRFGVL